MGLARRASGRKGSFLGLARAASEEKGVFFAVARCANLLRGSFLIVFTVCKLPARGLFCSLHGLQTPSEGSFSLFVKGIQGYN